MTNNERWIMQLIGEGRTIADIARLFNVRREVIGAYVKSALCKLEMLAAA